MPLLPGWLVASSSVKRELFRRSFDGLATLVVEIRFAPCWMADVRFSLGPSMETFSFCDVRAPFSDVRAYIHGSPRVTFGDPLPCIGLSNTFSELSRAQRIGHTFFAHKGEW